MGTDLTATAAKPKPKRRWFQYFWARLLFFVTLVGIACSWLVPNFREGIRQQGIVKKLGGTLGEDGFTCGDLFGRVRIARFYSKVSDSDLEPLQELSQLESLGLRETRVTGTGLGYLKGLPHLRGLDLYGAQVNDAGLEGIKGLSHLESLSLIGTQITDAGLEHLKGLSQLRALSLDDTRVTYKGVNKLQQSLPQCHIQR